MSTIKAKKFRRNISSMEKATRLSIALSSNQTQAFKNSNRQNLDNYY